MFKKSETIGENSKEVSILVSFSLFQDLLSGCAPLWSLCELPGGTGTVWHEVRVVWMDLLFRAGWSESRFNDVRLRVWLLPWPARLQVWYQFLPSSPLASRPACDSVLSSGPQSLLVWVCWGLAVIIWLSRRLTWHLWSVFLKQFGTHSYPW